ncbi:hypothetical protein ACFSJY_19250 [Thalassotalea euphylliae]|uniref:hypothetical protein n=1 Tax=Thalassotalea euphylliae TaxID=1655234 RepID=UPI00363DC007
MELTQKPKRGRTQFNDTILYSQSLGHLISIDGEFTDKDFDSAPNFYQDDFQPDPAIVELTKDLNQAQLNALAHELTYGDLETYTEEQDSMTQPTQPTVKTNNEDIMTTISTERVKPKALIQFKELNDAVVLRVHSDELDANLRIGIQSKIQLTHSEQLSILSKQLEFIESVGSIDDQEYNIELVRTLNGIRQAPSGASFVGGFDVTVFVNVER